MLIISIYNMSKSKGIFEISFVIFSFLILSGAIIPVFQKMRGITSEDNDPIKLITLLAISIGIIFLSLRLYQRAFFLAIKAKSLWVVVGVSLLSVFWSAAPLETLRSVITLLISTLLGLYLAVRYSLNEQLRLLAWALGIAALFSLLVALILPSYGITDVGDILNFQEISHQGAWKGIYGHKNILGRCMSLGAIVFLLLANNSITNNIVVYVFFALCVIVLLFSTSKSAFVIFLAIMITILFYKSLPKNRAFIIPGLIITSLTIGSLATLLLSNLEVILSIFGKTTTLSGRTLLWATVFDKILDSPWLGYGYGGFWLGWKGESADIWRIVQWETPHAHNGFLDLWLELGLLGLIAFIVSSVLACFRAVSLVYQNHSIDSFYPLIYLNFLFLANTTESFLIGHPFAWMLYVLSIFSIERVNQESKNTFNPESYLYQKPNQTI